MNVFTAAWRAGGRTRQHRVVYATRTSVPAATAFVLAEREILRTKNAGRRSRVASCTLPRQPWVKVRVYAEDFGVLLTVDVVGPLRPS